LQSRVVGNGLGAELVVTEVSMMSAPDSHTVFHMNGLKVKYLKVLPLTICVEIVLVATLAIWNLSP
jgi:hypothetical protein